MKKGLALQGGGAKGAYQIGVLSTLFDKGYTFDAAVGTSIGSLNAAMIVQKEFDKAVELWKNISISQLLDIDEEMLFKLTSFNFDRKSLMYGWNYLRKVLGNRGLETDKLIAFIERYVNEEKIRESEIDFGLCTYRVDTKETVRLMKRDIPQGQLVQYILASANFPLFERMVIDDVRYMDGGLRDNLPINLLIENGYDDILAVSLGDSICPIDPPKDDKVKITYIRPSNELCGTLSFGKENSMRLIKMGELDALRLTDNLGGIKYYLYESDGFELTALLMRLPSDFYKKVIEEYKLAPYLDKQQAIITVTEYLAKQFKTVPDVYRVWLQLLETFAEYTEMEKYKIYRLNEFIDDLITILKTQDIKLSSSLIKKITLRSAKEARALQVFVWFLDAIKGLA